jgi:hypothetical protein
VLKQWRKFSHCCTSRGTYYSARTVEEVTELKKSGNLLQCLNSWGGYRAEKVEELITVLEQLGRLQSWKSRGTYYSGDRVRNLLTLPKQSGKFSHCCYIIPRKPITLFKQLGKLLQRWNSRRKWSHYFNTGDLTSVKQVEALSQYWNSLGTSHGAETVWEPFTVLKKKEIFPWYWETVGEVAKCRYSGRSYVISVILSVVEGSGSRWCWGVFNSKVLMLMSLLFCYIGTMVVSYGQRVPSSSG